MIEQIKDRIKELWTEHKYCVICAVAGFVLGAIIL
tara:strand:- start:401 stop:505 length:105 start_codon:yes stop_codon:yes gene_type:complete